VVGVLFLLWKKHAINVTEYCLLTSLIKTGLGQVGMNMDVRIVKKVGVYLTEKKT
jgi:hypothetical protein